MKKYEKPFVFIESLTSSERLATGAGNELSATAPEGWILEEPQIISNGTDPFSVK